ncbi:MAG: PAS domain S-box protein [Thermoleophilia bacterium]
MSGNVAQSMVRYAGLTAEQAAAVRAGALAGHVSATVLRDIASPPVEALAVVLPAVLAADVLRRWGGPSAAPPVLAVAPDEAAGAAAVAAGAAMALLEPLTPERVRLRLLELAAGRMGQSLAGVLESMRQGFLAVGADGRIAVVNDAFCELVGYRRDELVGAVPPYPFWAPEAEAELRADLRTMLDREESSLRLRYRHRSGRRLTVEANGSALTGPDGVPAGGVGLFRDVTDQVAAEEELRASAAELRGLVDHLPAAAALRLPDGRLRLNARARELTGWPEDELRTVDDWFRLLYGERAAEVEARYEASRAQGFRRSRIGRLSTPAGTRCWSSSPTRRRMAARCGSPPT